MCKRAPRKFFSPHRLRIRNSFIDSPTLSAEVAVVKLDSEQTIAVVSECSAPWQTVRMPAVN